MLKEELKEKMIFLMKKKRYLLHKYFRITDGKTKEEDEVMHDIWLTWSELPNNISREKTVTRLFEYIDEQIDKELYYKLIKEGIEEVESFW